MPLSLCSVPVPDVFPHGVKNNTLSASLRLFKPFKTFPPALLYNKIFSAMTALLLVPFAVSWSMLPMLNANDTSASNSF